MIDVSVGVIAYNEEENIGRLLDALLSQKTIQINIIEIIVVSSACTDNTDNIVREYEKKDNKIKLIAQEKREGKSSAINLYVKAAKGEICILESADTVPETDTLENLCLPFIEDTKVGMTGSHPIPLNDENTFMGFIVHLLWRLHH